MAGAGNDVDASNAISACVAGRDGGVGDALVGGNGGGDSPGSPGMGEGRGRGWRTLNRGYDGYTGGRIKGAAPVRAAGMVEIGSAGEPIQRRGAQVREQVWSRTGRGFRRHLHYPGLGARKPPHRFRPKTPESFGKLRTGSASPLGEGAKQRSRWKVLAGELGARKTLTPTLSHRAREQERPRLHSRVASCKGLVRSYR